MKQIIRIQTSLGEAGGGSGGGGASELGYIERTSNYLITDIAEEVIGLDNVQSDGVTPLMVQFYSPDLSMPPATTAYIVMYVDGVQVGYLGTFITGTEPTDSILFAARRGVIAAGTHRVSIIALKVGGSAIIRAGSGGSGLFPMFLRVTRA